MMKKKIITTIAAKKKIITTIAALSMTASMTMPVFAAPLETTANNQTSKVPVVGQIGWLKPGNTDINNPSSPGSGSQGENGEVQKPENVTDINVTVPTSMTFDIVTNTTNNEPVFASPEYTVTNNGTATINMTGKYDVTPGGGVNLVAKDSVSPKGDGTINLALNLKYGADTPNQEFITNVVDEATSQQEVALSQSTSTKLQFTSDEQGMADIKQEALKGTFADQTKITKGNLVLTFQTKAE